MIPNISPFQKGDKVVAYCRYSEGDEQGLKNQSTEEQEAAIRKFCTAAEIDLVRVYADPFASGRSVAKRDKYLEMLSYLLHKKKPDVQGVVLWDFERYGRNYDQAQLDAARLRMAGYKLFSLQQPITDEGPFAHVLEAMYFASAQNQSDMISADVKRALQHNFQTYKVIPRSCIGFGFVAEPVDMGYYSDGSRRIGYRAVPDPARVSSMREAIEARLRGASLSQCRKILGAPNNLDVKRFFGKTQLYGAFTYGDTTIEDYSEPVITKEKFDALQIFEKAHPGRQIGRVGGWSPNPPMLSGLLYCAECGSPMYITRRNVKGHLYCTYRCSERCFPGVKQEILEPFIIDQCEIILNPENLKNCVDQLAETDSTEAMEQLRTDTEKELITIEKRISTAIDLLLDHPSESLQTRLSAMEARQKELQTRLKKLSQSTVTGFDADTLYKSTLELSERILDVLRSQEATDEIKKTALSSFVRSIVVSESRKVIVNYILPKVGHQTDTVPHLQNEKYEEIRHQSPRIPKAPPEGDYSHAQLIPTWYGQKIR